MAGRLISVTSAEGKVSEEYTYDCMGRVLQKKGSDGILRTYTYIRSQMVKMT